MTEDASRASAVVSVVIAAFHRPRSLEQLLQALAVPGPLEVVVVNIESDDEVQKLADRHGALHVATKRNVGYAAAVNAGTAVAAGDVIVFCNDDLVVGANEIHSLAQPIRSGGADVVVPALADEAGAVQRTILPLPTVARLALEWLLLPDRPPFVVRHLGVEKWRAPRRSEPIDAATAAIVAVRADVLRAMPLPEDYFLYWEELDWFWQLHKADVRVEYRPEIVVTHRGGRDDVRPEKARLMARNAVRCVRRTQGRGRAALAVPVVILWSARLLVFAVLRRRHVAARLAGLGAALSSGREVWR